MALPRSFARWSGPEVTTLGQFAHCVLDAHRTAGMLRTMPSFRCERRPDALDAPQMLPPSWNRCASRPGPDQNRERPAGCLETLIWPYFPQAYRPPRFHLTARTYRRVRRSALRKLPRAENLQPVVHAAVWRLFCLHSRPASPVLRVHPCDVLEPGLANETTFSPSGSSRRRPRHQSQPSMIWSRARSTSSARCRGSIGSAARR